jgi:hypothetical protein
MAHTISLHENQQKPQKRRKHRQGLKKPSCAPAHSWRDLPLDSHSPMHTLWDKTPYTCCSKQGTIRYPSSSWHGWSMDQNLKANQKYHWKYNHFFPQKLANLFSIFLGTLIDLQKYQTNRFPLKNMQAPKEPQPQKYHYIIIKLLQSVFFFQGHFSYCGNKENGKILSC